MTIVSAIGRLAADQRVILTIQADQTVMQAATMLSSHRVGVLVVLDAEGQPVGIISERDIVAKVVTAGRDGAATPVGDVMTAPLISCGSNDDIEHAEQLMTRHHIRHLPVVRNGKVIGMLSSRDILLHELTATREIARKQCQILTDLEGPFPGITSLQTDAVGRVII